MNFFMLVLPALLSPSDPFQTMLYLRLTSGGTLYDASGNSNVTINTGASAGIATSPKKYGNYSMSFTTTQTFVQVLGALPPSEILNNHTVEFWLYHEAYIANRRNIAMGSQSNGNYADAQTSAMKTSAGGNYTFFTGSSPSVTNSSISQQWSHLAITFTPESPNCRIKVYQNGVSGSSVVVSDTSTSLPLAHKICLGIGAIGAGGTINNTVHANMYLDSFRLTRGVRYTATFNPETDTGMAW